MTAKDKVWIYIPDAKLGGFARGIHQVPRARCIFEGLYFPPGCVKFFYRGPKFTDWVYIPYGDTVEALIERVNRPILTQTAQKEQEIEALRAFIVKLP